jgi:hypothetical protein
MMVLTAIFATSGVAASVDPALKPIQPTSSSSAPADEMMTEWPGIGRTAPSGAKRPLRAPSTIRPASATQPPIECTTVDPAKSMKPSFASQLAFCSISALPQAQWPKTG